MYEDSIKIARDYLDSMLVESRIIGATKPSTKVKILGTEFRTPIMTAALSHIDLVGMAEGANEAGALVSIGMGDNDEFEKVLNTGAKVMKIIKPYADRDEIFKRLDFAREHKAFAVGMDVEHAPNVNDPEDSVVMGKQMKLPTYSELREYVEYTDLPFFIKGALSVRDAILARDLGCKGIILSHHNGLMRCAVPPVMLLPDIREEIGDDLILIADGGFETGFDCFKGLASGADLVTVGKKLMDPLKEEGAQGVTEIINKMTSELAAMMLRTSSKDPHSIDPSVIWFKG
ncbi:MAG: alpha-hydroxy-acid oxidizing protein [Clostridiales bacterium]|nr:alpha-hydroxy-acid oxidizing protein [Clostridiales bacterium]